MNHAYKFLSTTSVLLLLCFVVLFFCFFKSACQEYQPIGHTNDSVQVIKSIPMPEQLDFAGEAVPLANFDSREALERELMVNVYWHSHTLLVIKRAGRFFPIIEPILKKNGIPDDFKYLAVIESDLSNVVSPAGAAGFWQFLERTGREYGLEIGPQVDERYHLEKATEAACRYLREAHARFGSWSMAAASYNMGKNGVSRQTSRQGAETYYDLVLGEETERYVFRILALKILMTNPEKYGYFLNKSDYYKPWDYYEVAVDSSITDFSSFATRYNTNYKMIKILNPWLRDNNLVNKMRKTYQIRIPKDGMRTNN